MAKINEIDMVVVGGGQAGLAVGYYLAQLKRDFVILDAYYRTGDSWRKRWASLRLFTPASFNSLPGIPFPKPLDHSPTKDEMADYLETYADRFQLPVQRGVKVNELVRDGDRYLITTDRHQLKANQVIVATGAYATAQVPSFADQLNPAITQLHSVTYRNPGQLGDGLVLVVGAGNSGVEIALDLAPRQPVVLAGRDTGFIPANFNSLGYQIGTIVFKALMQWLTVDTWPGRWLVRQARAFMGGHPVIGVTPADLARAGVQRVPRVAGVSGGRPRLADERALEVASVVWATGFVRNSHRAWIKLPVFDKRGELIHHRGVVTSEPGLYFVGLPFQSSLLSGLVAGVGDDAKYVIRQIEQRARATHPSYARRLGPLHG